MHPAALFILLQLTTKSTQGNLLQAIVSFHKLDDCTLLEDQQQVNLQLAPNEITEELQSTKNWIEKYYMKVKTDSRGNKLDSTTAAVFTPLLYKINQLLETQEALTNSFQQMSTNNRQKRAIKNILISLLSKSIVKAVKTSAISSLQTILTDQFTSRTDEVPQQYKQVALYKSITKELKNKLQRGENGQHMLNKISANTLKFLKALQKQEAEVKLTIAKAEDAQQHHLKLLHSLIKKTLDINIATRLQIPQTIEDIQVSNLNNSFNIKFTYFNTSRKIIRVAIDTGSFNINNSPYTIALPDEIALISNTTYIKNPSLQCYTPQQSNCACTELNKIEAIPPCIQQVIKAKKHLTHNPTLCAPHLKPSDSRFNVMRVKNNIFSIFSSHPRNYTINCNNKPTNGIITSGLNILSIPYECTLDTDDIKLKNQMALPHQVGPSHTQIDKDVNKIKQALENTQYSPKKEISVTDITLAIVQLLIGLILCVIIIKLKQSSTVPSRLITPIPDIQQ